MQSTITRLLLFLRSFWGALCAAWCAFVEVMTRSTPTVDPEAPGDPTQAPTPASPTVSIPANPSRLHPDQVKPEEKQERVGLINWIGGLNVCEANALRWLAAAGSLAIEDIPRNADVRHAFVKFAHSKPALVMTDWDRFVCMINPMLRCELLEVLGI